MHGEKLTTDDNARGLTAPTPLDLLAFIPYACVMLGAPFNVRLDIRIQEEYVSKLESTRKQNKSRTTSRQPSGPETEKVEESDATPSPIFCTEEGEVSLIVVINMGGHIVEVGFRGQAEVPCMLIKIIGMCLPYQQLISKIIIRYSNIDGPALYELSKLLPEKQITEICLDDSPVPECNYGVLLQETSNLRQLSFARCDLDDEDIITICSKLVYPLPASKTLQILNLASNIIADPGACAVGKMLRSNRSLQYINLSGNMITDDGAKAILCSLMPFALTDDEIMKKRIRKLEHLKSKKEVFDRCLRDVVINSEFARSRISKKAVTRTSKKVERSSLETNIAKAEAMAEDILGNFADPFALDETMNIDRILHSIGNRSLCCLNLCYNNLGYSSVVRLLEVLHNQSSGSSKFGTGLMRVLVEGNLLPVASEQYDQIEELLENIFKAKEAAYKKSQPKSAVNKSKIKQH